MQEQCGRQESRHQISQINDFVEIVQLARVVEREQDEAGHAQDEKVQRARSASAAEVDEQSDGQIHGADRVLIKDGGIALGLADDDVAGDLDAVVQNLVLDFFPGAEPRQHRRDIQRALDGEVGDRNQAVALMDSGLLAGTSGGDVDRDHGRILAGALALIEPGDAVVGQVEFVLLLKVDGSGNHGRHGDDHQQRTDELLPQFLHRTDLAHH